ncbi:MAG: TylF/MycF/NovP-related O-methyltransferase [Planctomycetota bacterium]
MASSDVSAELRSLLDGARAALDAGEVAQALESVSKAKAGCPIWADADALRARCFLAQGSRPSAEQAAREALRADPMHADAKAILDEVAPPAEKHENPLIDAVRPHTMLGIDRLKNLVALVRGVARDGIEGDFVECGVAGGGSLGLLALASEREGLERRIIGCDTFEGMPEPEEADTAGGTAAAESGWGAGTCAAHADAVRSNLLDIGGRAGTGVTNKRVELVPGRFEDTLEPLAARLASEGRHVALLHCDGDWLSSTRAILKHLTPRLAPGAFVQIDDYGHWSGCKQAVDEFLAGLDHDLELRPIDYTGRWLRWPR